MEGRYRESFTVWSWKQKSCWDYVYMCVCARLDTYTTLGNACPELCEVKQQLQLEEKKRSEIIIIIHLSLKRSFPLGPRSSCVKPHSQWNTDEVLVSVWFQKWSDQNPINIYFQLKLWEQVIIESDREDRVIIFIPSDLISITAAQKNHLHHRTMCVFVVIHPE